MDIGDKVMLMHPSEKMKNYIDHTGPIPGPKSKTKIKLQSWMKM